MRLTISSLASIVLIVSAALGTSAAAEGEKAEPDAVQRALPDPFDRAELPLRLATYVVGPSPSGEGKVEVIVAGELREDALETPVVVGRAVSEPRVVLSIEERDRPAPIAERCLKIEPGAAQQERGYSFATRVALLPGEHRVRLVAQSGGRVGSLTADIVVPALADEWLWTPILWPVLDADARAAIDRLKAVPIVDRSFTAADTLHCRVEVHGAKVAPEK